MIQQTVDREECLAQYAVHLTKTRGLALTTQRVHSLIARRFLSSLSHRLRFKQSKITARSVLEFVRSDASRGTGRGPGVTVAATRSFLRFLRTQGMVGAELEASVPTMRCYRHASLPPCFTESETANLLACSNDGTKKGIRNYALLLMVSRLGLRIGEIAMLTLDDIDWVHGFIVIPAGKTRTERQLPLPQDLAEGILKYLQHGRPKVEDRHLFLHVLRPFKGYDGSALGKVISRILIKHRMKQRFGGPHQFRHSAATRMVNSGASFKQIADLLGHGSLASTAVYAKLDFETLTKIALPWPGGTAHAN
jgi:integrase/recombinase XerD